MRSVLLSLAIVLFTGCSRVFVSEPLFTPIEADAADELNGTWHIGEGAVYVHHLGDGKLRISYLEWDNTDFQMRRMNGVITTHDKAVYLFVEYPDAKHHIPGWAMYRVGRSDDNLVLYQSNLGTFKKLVESGALKGTLIKDEHVARVVITSPKADVEKMILPEKAGEQFNLDDAPVARKLK